MQQSNDQNRTASTNHPTLLKLRNGSEHSSQEVYISSRSYTTKLGCYVQPFLAYRYNDTIIMSNKTLSLPISPIVHYCTAPAAVVPMLEDIRKHINHGMGLCRLSCPVSSSSVSDFLALEATVSSLAISGLSAVRHHHKIANWFCRPAADCFPLVQLGPSKFMGQSGAKALLWGALLIHLPVAF